jgi:hypothetical protein
MTMPELLKENNIILAHIPGAARKMYFDIPMSIVANRPVLDLPKFESMLDEVYGPCEMSMKKFITREFGKDFADYIQRML